jgi:chemotaxis protein CheZ
MKGAMSWLTVSFEHSLQMNLILSCAAVHILRGNGAAMPVQRKIFRIEEGARRHVAGVVAGGAVGAQQQRELMTELQALRGLVGPRTGVDRDALERARAQIAEAQAYKHELGLILAAVERTRNEMTALAPEASASEQTGRACRELAAIVGGTERATQSILQAAEEIDQAANILSASVKGSHDQGLAHDIQDRVVQIFEACNFQDLTGQRVAHVMTTLKFIEEHIARLLAIWHGIEQFTPVAFGEEADGDRRFLNGPKLPEDRGHSTQDAIDTMFDCT